MRVFFRPSVQNCLTLHVQFFYTAITPAQSWREMQMNRDMHEHLLGQHQRRVDQDALIEQAEDAAAHAAHKARKAEVLKTLAAGGPAAAELLSGHDCHSKLDVATLYDVVAEMLRCMSAGSTDAAQACLSAHLETVAEAEAQDAGTAAMCAVARRVL